MNTHVYLIALPALPEEYAYALDPATGCVVFRAPKATEWFLSICSTNPIYVSRDRSAGTNRLILVEAPEGYRFKRDLNGQALVTRNNTTNHIRLYNGNAHHPQQEVGPSNVPNGAYYILEKLPEPIPAPPEGFEWVLDEQGNRIQGTPAPGGYGISTQVRVCGKNVVVGDYYGNPIPFTCYLLKKIKPSYTEAVKAAGFKKWPFSKENLTFSYNKDGSCHAHQQRTPKTGDNFWISSIHFNPSNMNPSLLPPRLADDYEWHETLLCIDDFEV